MSSTFRLDDNSRLAFDAAVTRGNGGSVENSLIDSVSDVYAESIGVSYLQDNAFKKGDNFTISLKQPMRIFSGSANMVTSSVDENGNPVITSHNVSLKPEAVETDLSVGYSAPLQDNMQWSADLTARHNDGNVQGENSVGFMMKTKLSF
jgi:hypothetical protein